MEKPYEKAKYRVVLTKNGKYFKTVHRSRTRETIFINYNKIKAKNKVFFPRKFINTRGIKPVKYGICVIKVTEPTDTFRVLRDDYGRIYTEESMGEWTILDSNDFFVEEEFWVYGMDKKMNRPNITEVIKKLLTGAHAKNAVKQIIVVYNKLLIYNEHQFDMVICKNILDAQRLHHTLAAVAKKQKLKNLLFMGTASKTMIGRMYDLIMDNTGWNTSKVYKKTTAD